MVFDLKEQIGGALQQFTDRKISIATEDFAVSQNSDKSWLKRRDSDYKPRLGSKEFFQKRAKKCCTRKSLTRKLPFLNWLPTYSFGDSVGDLIAGITVGFTVIPQSIAYADLAHLPTQYGLYASFIGPFIYILFGTTKEVTVGPTAVMSLMTATYVASHGPIYAVILCFLSGIICCLMGLFKLGVCVELISNPVTSGFASAAAVIIACSQLKSLLGLKDIHGERLIEILQGVAEKLHATNFYDLGMGITAILLLTALKSAKDVNLGRCIKDAKVLKITEKIVWVVSTARNVLIVVLCGLVAVHVNNARGEKLFTLTSTVKSGIPNPAFPPFSIEDSFQNDSLTGETNFVKGQSYFEILSDAGSAIVIIPLLGILELIAICKTFAKGKPVDANQEMIALGMCQIAGAFFQSMPITGSFSRCAVNGASGVKTPLGGLYTGVIVLLALGFLTPYFEFIPRAALAAIIVCAVIYMIEIEEAIHVWRTKKIDLVPMLSTFFACLVIGIEIGILIGVAVNASMIILFSALPKVSVTKSTLQDETAVIFLTPDRAIHFLAVEKVRNLFSKTIFKNKDAVVVLDFQHVIDLDFTAAKGFVSLSQGMKERKQNLVFVNVNCDVEKTLHGLQANMEIYQSAADWISQRSNGNNAIAIPMDAEKHNQV